MAFQSFSAPGQWRFRSEVRMKSSFETSRALARAFTFSFFPSPNVCPPFPPSFAVLAIFAPCSSVPVKKNTSSRREDREDGEGGGERRADIRGRKHGEGEGSC